MLLSSEKWMSGGLWLSEREGEAEHAAKGLETFRYSCFQNRLFERTKFPLRRNSLFGLWSHREASQLQHGGSDVQGITCHLGTEEPWWHIG